MPKDYTQRRNERWETVFPGIGLESILGRILRIARYHNHKSTETMKPFGIKNGEADVLSALLHAGPPYTLNPKDITKQGDIYFTADASLPVQNPRLPPGNAG